MQIIDAGEFLLAAGLDWEVSATGGFQPQQVTARARTHKSDRYVAHTALKAGSERVYGFGATQKLPRKEKRPLLSMASLIARLGQSDKFAFLAPLEGDTLAFVGVYAGQPYPGADLVGPAEKIVGEVELFVTTHSINTIYFAPTLGEPDIELPGRTRRAMPLAPTADDIRLCELLPVPAQNTAALAALGLGALVLAGGGLTMWHLHEQALEQEAAAATQLSPADVYRTARDSAFAGLPRIPAAGLADRIAGAVMSTPLHLAGWSLAKVECSTQHNALLKQQAAGGAPLCVFEWSAPKSAPATFEQFAQGWHGAAPVFDRTLKTVFTSTDISTSGVAMLAAAQRYPGGQDFLRRDGTFFQAIGPLALQVQLGTPTLVGSPARPEVPGMVEQATWSVRGPVDLLKLVLKAMPSNMALSDLTVTLPQAGDDATRIPTFDARGTLYVQAR